jgi:excisionase family DNA binding protein
MGQGAAMSEFDEILADESFITVAEAAELLDITENAVRKRIQRSSLPATKVGRDWRIRLADLEAERIIDVDLLVSRPATAQHATGHGPQQDVPQRDNVSDDELRDVTQEDDQMRDSAQHDVPQRDGSQSAVPQQDARAGSVPGAELRLAEQQLAIFVDQFVRPKEERIAELERQIGRIEVQSESLDEERSAVRSLERENGQLSERIRQLEGELSQHEAETDHQRDTKSWWRFWTWGLAGRDELP